MMGFQAWSNCFGTTGKDKINLLKAGRRGWL
jgi:hypothetical protein